jgi:hypothetical protein
VGCRDPIHQDNTGGPSTRFLGVGMEHETDSGSVSEAGFDQGLYDSLSKVYSFVCPNDLDLEKHLTSRIA